MSRYVIIAVSVSVLFHAGAAASGAFFREKPAAPVAEAAIPTIALDQPPPPEPEEPEVLDVSAADKPVDIADLAPPTQADIPSAVIDSPFVQAVQPTVSTTLNRTVGVTIPASTRPAASAQALGRIFDLSALDQRPVARGRINPIYPANLKRSGLKGEVLVEFIVDSTGNVQNAFVVKSSHQGFDDAALQAVSRARFQPGRKGGAAVNTRVQLPIGFSIET